MLALTGAARRWEPKRLRLRLFSVAGRLASSGRRLWLRLAERWPWAADITAAAARLPGLSNRLTSRNSPYDKGGQTPGPVEPAHPGDSRATSHGGT